VPAARAPTVTCRRRCRLASSSTRWRPALITQGKSNAEIAQLTYLSPNTVKSYIRTIYRKIDVDSRTKAVLWGIGHGFTPDHHRIDHWRPAQ
jgi:hypothetical protein